jgi:hypothetical protein
MTFLSPRHPVLRAPILLALSAAACGGAGAGPARDGSPAPADRADPRAALCASAGAADAAPGAAPPFEIMQAIFDNECTSCHTTGADLDLSDGRAWGDLVGKQAPRAESCGGVLVVPGAPDASYLYQKLSSSHPCSGMQMPIAELFSNPLPACVVGLVRAWIAAGAAGPGAADAAIVAD